MCIRDRPLRCSKRNKLKSKDHTPQTFLRFRNNTTQTIYLYWINFEGEEELHSAIVPLGWVIKPRENHKNIKPDWFDDIHEIIFVQEVMDWDTFLTHPWVLGVFDRCLNIYLPIEEPGIVAIEEKDLKIEISNLKLATCWAKIKDLR